MKNSLGIGFVIGAAVALTVAFARSRSPIERVETGPPRDEVVTSRFAEERVDIRSGPGLEHDAINYLPPGMEVLVGEPDEDGWLAVLDPIGDTIGFVMAASMSELPPAMSGRHFELEGLVVPVR